MKPYLKILFEGRALQRDEARSAMRLMMEGQATPEEIAAFLGAMAAKGVTSPELVGCVEAMREKALSFATKRKDLIDVCGTGGDDLGTFNISTTNALLLASLGLGVVKHGNRAVSSQSGSADVLEKLGVAVGGQVSVEAFEKSGFVFLFAPEFHPAMKHVGPVRRALGVRTLFNILGPLANPAPVRRQVVGVYHPRLVPLVAEALRDLGCEEAIVVWGEDGLDEFSISTHSRAAYVRAGAIEELRLGPEDFGLSRSPLDQIKGGDSSTNAEITRAIFLGEKGPRRDIVLMNASAALRVAGIAKDWKEGVQLAADAIDSGKVMAKLKDLQGSGGKS